MPYTPPSQRSPAASSTSSPSTSRRSSYGPGATLSAAPSPSSRPDLPRSTSYLTRHRRTPSVKTASFALPTESEEPTPPATADGLNDEPSTLSMSSSIRQSPPPITDEKQMPAGVVLSPPESTQNSSDDEDSVKKDHTRELSNLAELQAAIRVIGQHRSSSPMRQAADAARVNQALTLVTPAGDKVELITSSESGELLLTAPLHKISHQRSNTDSTVFDLRQSETAISETPVTGSEEDESDDEPERSRRKPPMLRKKSGELVRPALRPSSARRRPSSMPGTPTFSKAVHFDSHLEHVRHFLQVDRPLAVSAGSSPVEAYESDTEFPFGEDDSKRSPPFEWEIVVSNFPGDSHQRLQQPVRVERVYLSADNKNLVGSVAVANLAFNKTVVARFTLDYWKTTSEVVAEYCTDVRRKNTSDGYDRFNFSIKLADQANLEAKTMFFCVKYLVNGIEYWDNNSNTNFQIDFRKKAKPQNGKRGLSGASSRPANGLPRSTKKSPPAASKPVAPTFDDFADGFDSSSQYGFANYKKPVGDFLETTTSNSFRLKGVKSAISLGSDALRKVPNPNGQFSNRYDFGASLSAAISAANSVYGDRSGITLKPSANKGAVKMPGTSSEVAKSVGSTSTSDAPGPKAPIPGTEQPVLASQSYNDLLDKYCFFGSVKSSPQLKDGTLGTRPGQFDGAADSYVLGSETSSANGSPIPTQTSSNPPPARMDSGGPKGRSTSPAPMTGFATGTSPMYPYHVHGGFPFNEAHAATAIRG